MKIIYICISGSHNLSKEFNSHSFPSKMLWWFSRESVVASLTKHPATGFYIHFGIFLTSGERWNIWNFGLKYNLFYEIEISVILRGRYSTLSTTELQMVHGFKNDVYQMLFRIVWLFVKEVKQKSAHLFEFCNKTWRCSGRKKVTQRRSGTSQHILTCELIETIIGEVIDPNINTNTAVSQEFVQKN